MQVTVAEWIAIVVFAGILVLATANVRRQWRGERPRRASSERTLRGRPSVVVVGWLMLAGVALTILGTNLGEPGAAIVRGLGSHLRDRTSAFCDPAEPSAAHRRLTVAATNTWHIPGTYRVRAQSRNAGNACNDGVALSDQDATSYRVRADRSG